MSPATKPDSIRLAVDIGGTFTDVVLETPSGGFSAKVLTTRLAPEDGVLDGMGRALALAGLAPGDVGLIVHGTTLATNAIIERKGARTALVTTRGLRDSIEMAQENRFEQYDIFIEKPEPLVPRDLRFTVAERIDARGGVRLPLDEAEVLALAGLLEARSIESIAIGFLHSYANPDHERRAAGILSARLPRARISLSSELCPEIREYERFSTTCANAYIQPLMARYLENLRERLTHAGFRCPILLMTSGGGLTTLETAIRFPIRLVESGPAGGVILANWIAGRFGVDRVLSFDMGGTTAKICIIDDGKPLASRGFEVDRRYRFMKGSGLPVRIPVIEMVEIGAGGGSLASVDAMKRITVGPESAGSTPGPACYQAGGTRPAVTDANVLLGRIDPAHFAGGSILLDAARADAAIDHHVAGKLGIGTTTAAFGISEMVEENMANAARVHAVERGAELEGRTLIAFGGGAPLHAARLAEKLGITDVLIPASAGVGSAVGFLRAPIAFEVVRSRFVRLGAFDPAETNDMFAALEREATDVVRLGIPHGAPIAIRRAADMRYAGQGHEILVELPDGPFTAASPADLKERFEAAYRRLFNRVVPANDVEVIGWILRAEADAPGDAVAPPESGRGGTAGPVAIGTRDLFDPALSAFQPVPVYQRASLRPGDTIQGPAVIAEDDTTIIVSTGFSAHRAALGAIRLTARARPATALTNPAGLTSPVQSGIAFTVMWNRLISVVEEQAQTLVRTAFGTATREAGDLSAGVYDTQGRMLAQAVTGTPGHVNSMAMSVGHVLAKVPLAQMHDGDAYIVNDPWLGTGHLNDIVIVTPTFRQGHPVGLFACTLHVVDIGGRGIMGAANQVYEEGLYLPITKIADRGEINQWLIDIIAANVREPVQVIGDIYSEISSNEVGGRRLAAMMDEFGLDTLDALADHILTRSRDASLAAIASLPQGTWHNTMMVDGIGGKPMEIKASLTIGADGIDVDFAGSPGAVGLGINVPLCYTEAYTSFGVKCIVAPRVPNNAGSLATIRVTAPEGSILNASYPAPVAARSIIGQMLPDVAFGCLGQALPGGVPAEGTSCLWNVRLMGGPGRVDADPAVLAKATAFNVTSFHSGGTGARPNLDGLSATAFPSGVRNVPVEITETLAPVLIWHKEYRTDSGGAGRYRGGLGQVMDIESAEDSPFGISTSFDRVVYPPRGRSGGKPGSTGRVEIVAGDVLPAKAHASVPAGRRLRISMPGGGGYGDPLERSPGKVAEDVARGFVSAREAREAYGVALTDALEVDEPETRRLRNALAE